MPFLVRMPKLSPTMESGILTAWCLSLGSKVKQGQVIAEIETDKAIMEVEALEEGELAYMKEAGKEMEVNSIIGCILKADETPPSSWEDYISSIEGKNHISPEETEKKKTPISEPYKGDNISERIVASPLAKRLAQQNGVNLESLSGSGPKGRIVEADVLSFLNVGEISSKNTFEEKIQIQNETSIIKKGFEKIAITPMRKVIAERLTASKQQAPHIYLEKRIKMDNLENLKKEIEKNFEFKVSLSPFFIKAIAKSLINFPKMNRSWAGDAIIQNFDANISVAVALDEGLVTPIIENADQKGIRQIAEELKELAQKAKQGKLRKEQMQGGSFSLSNLGMFGIDAFQAILNPPQAGILAVGASNIEPVFVENSFQPKKIMRAVLSCDHRVVDGSDAAKFLSIFAAYIENPGGMLL